MTKLHIKIERGPGKSAPLYEQIAAQIELGVADGTLSRGTRLPTVRDLAAELEVTTATVQSAYSELQNRGLVEAVVGRGTFVCCRPAPPDPATLLSGGGTAQAVLEDIRRLEGVAGVFSMASAHGDVRLSASADLVSLFAGLHADADRLLGYTSPFGESTLRHALVDHAAERGVLTAPQDVLVTSGTTQALDLIIDVLCSPGDCVIVERPTYLGFLGLLEARGIRAVGVGFDDEGPNLDEVEQILRRDAPRFFYTVPTFHNPTGMNMSPQRRADLLELAQRYGLLIVEDDINNRIVLEGETPPPMWALDRTDQVIYLDSFSKVLLPGLRVGYVVAPVHLRDRLARALQLKTLCGPALMQRALAEFLQRGMLDDHLRQVLPVYRRRRDTLLTAMEAAMPPGVEWTRPAGGYSVWLALPARPGYSRVYRQAVAAGVSCAPGESFLPSPERRRYLRLCFGNIRVDDIPAAAETLAEVIRHAPARSVQAMERDLVPVV